MQSRTPDYNLLGNYHPAGAFNAKLWQNEREKTSGRRRCRSKDVYPLWDLEQLNNQSDLVLAMVSRVPQWVRLTMGMLDYPPVGDNAFSISSNQTLSKAK